MSRETIEELWNTTWSRWQKSAQQLRTIQSYLILRRSSEKIRQLRIELQRMTQDLEQRNQSLMDTSVRLDTLLNTRDGKQN